MQGKNGEKRDDKEHHEKGDKLKKKVTKGTNQCKKVTN